MSKKITSIAFLIFASLASAVFISCSGDEPAAEVQSAVPAEVVEKAAIMKDVNIEEMKSLIADKSAVLLDVRTLAECEEGIIPGAMNNDVTEQGFKKRVSEMDKNAPVIVYCKSGRRSTNAMAIMNKLGFMEVYNLKGGYELYEAHEKDQANKSAKDSEPAK